MSTPRARTAWLRFVAWLQRVKPRPRHRADSGRVGRRGERAAARWLQARGYRCLAQRWRTPYGEVDLLVRRKRVVLLVEVKATGRAGARPPLHRLRRVQAARLARAARWTARQRAARGYRVGLGIVGIALGREPMHVVFRIIVHDAAKRR